MPCRMRSHRANLPCCSETLICLSYTVAVKTRASPRCRLSTCSLPMPPSRWTTAPCGKASKTPTGTTLASLMHNSSKWLAQNAHGASLRMASDQAPMLTMHWPCACSAKSANVLGPLNARGSTIENCPMEEDLLKATQVAHQRSAASPRCCPRCSGRALRSSGAHVAWGVVHSHHVHPFFALFLLRGSLCPLVTHHDRRTGEL